MKRVVSVLLLACMLVSLMGMSAAAYAEELPDGSTAPAQETAEQSVGEQGQPEEEETPDPTGQPPQTAAPQPAGQPGAAAAVRDAARAAGPGRRGAARGAARSVRSEEHTF